MLTAIIGSTRPGRDGPTLPGSCRTVTRRGGDADRPHVLRVTRIAAALACLRERRAMYRAESVAQGFAVEQAATSALIDAVIAAAEATIARCPRR